MAGHLFPAAAAAAAVFAGAVVPLAARSGLQLAVVTDKALQDHRPVTALPSLCLGAALAATVAGLADSPDAGVVAAAVMMGGILVCDMDNFIIPDGLVLALAVVGLAWRPFAGSASPITLAVSAALAFGLGRLFAWLIHRRLGPSAFGLGDVNLMAVLGACLPPIAALSAIVTACVLALASAVLRPSDRVAFGPYLVCALALVGLVVRDRLVAA